MPKDEAKKKEVPRLNMVDVDDPNAIKHVLSAIHKSEQFKNSVEIAQVAPAEQQSTLYPTGILSLDLALGIGGLLGGRIVNCWGGEGTGKTLTAMTVGAGIQRTGGLVAFLDAEGSFSRKFAESCGLDVDKLIYVRSTAERLMSGEDFFEVARLCVQQGVHFIIIDSAAALIPSQKLTSVFGEGQQATQARLMSEELQKLTAYQTGNPRSIIWFTNQVRQKPMVMFGPKDGPTGGEALKFYMSYGFHMSKVSDITKKIRTADGRLEEANIGVSVTLSIVKNKTATRPIEPIKFDLYTIFATDADGVVYKPGVDVYKDMFEVGKRTGVITQKSSWYQFGDVRGNGDYDFQQNLRKNQEVTDRLRSVVLGQSPNIDQDAG